MKKVLIIEDDESIRRLLEYDLKQASYDVTTTIDGYEALEAVEASEFDAIIVDWMLPKYDGIQVVEKLRKDKVKSIILMLTAKNEECDILDAFDAGVDDYLTKPFSPRILKARLKAHLNRTSSDTNEIQTFGNTQIYYDQHKVEIDGIEINLTKKEYDLFIYLINNMNRVVSRDQILFDIWDFEYDGDTRIIDVHVFKLRHKIESSNILIESVRGVGYIAKQLQF